LLKAQFGLPIKTLQARITIAMEIELLDVPPVAPSEPCFSRVEFLKVENRALYDLNIIL
jgi:hypothetical protein